MNCKNLKLRKKKGQAYLYCLSLRKIISYSDCKYCERKEYREYKKIKQYTYQRRKKDKNRHSVFTSDLKHCIECGRAHVNLHEIFFGKNRNNSIKYNFIIPLCDEEHHNQINCRGIHFNHILCLKWQKRAQMYFETYIGTHEEFISIFGSNYLSK